MSYRIDWWVGVLRESIGSDGGGGCEGGVIVSHIGQVERGRSGGLNALQASVRVHYGVGLIDDGSALGGDLIGASAHSFSFIPHLLSHLILTEAIPESIILTSIVYKRSCIMQSYQCANVRYGGTLGPSIPQFVRVSAMSQCDRGVGGEWDRFLDKHNNRKRISRDDRHTNSHRI